MARQKKEEIGDDLIGHVIDVDVETKDSPTHLVATCW